MGYNLPSEYTKTPDLRGRTIQRIMTEGLFDMNYWYPNEKRNNGSCKTACCLAGNIVLAARDLGLSAPVPESYVDLAAKSLWHKQYGLREAEKLFAGFYGGFGPEGRRPMTETPEDTVAFIYRCWRESSAHG